MAQRIKDEHRTSSGANKPRNAPIRMECQERECQKHTKTTSKGPLLAKIGRTEALKGVIIIDSNRF